MKGVVCLAAVALVALLMLTPAAMAQGTQPKTMEETVKMETTQPLPSSGGPAVASGLLPASALLVGSRVLAYAVLRWPR